MLLIWLSARITDSGFGLMGKLKQSKPLPSFDSQDVTRVKTLSLLTILNVVDGTKIKLN